jgi:thiamine kinase-like enzyme
VILFKKAIVSLFKNGLNITLKKIIYTRRQNRFLKHYYNKSTILKAIKIGEKIIKMFPENLYNYQQLARAYWKNKDNDSALKILKKGIKVNYNIDLEEVICEIERSIAKNNIFISSKFTFMGGHQNFGLIEHELEDKILLTKILPFKESKGEFIIKDLQQKNKTFKNITPSILNILTIKDLCFITMEKFDGEEPKIIDSNLIKKVIELNRSITSIEYSELPKILNEHSSNQINTPLNRHELYKIFYQFNNNNEEVFSSIKQFFINNNYPLESLEIVDYLNKIIVVYGYYKQIIPQNHYSLQHGDFLKDNMLTNYQSMNLKVIDWGGIRVGPRWVDLAVFFAVTKETFNNILQNFLENKYCDFEPIEKLFFVYTLMVAWIGRCNKEEFMGSYQSFCNPALEYFEKLIVECDKGEKITG